MDQRLIGRRALVTGASGGIGLEIARVLASHGASLVLAARRTDELARHAEEIGTAHGVAVDHVTVDLAKPTGARELIDAVAERRHDIDVLVNNAGRGIHGDGLNHDWDDEAAMLQLNVVTLCELTKHYGRAMRARGRGFIVQIASTAAFQPCPTYAAYGATKAFVLQHAGALAEELRDSGVKVLAVCPGSTNTQFFETSGNVRNPVQVRTSLDPEEVARKTVEAMLAGKRTIVTGASNKLGAVGTRLIPRRLQAILARKILE